MPLKKKDRDRLFEKDLEKGENSTVAPFSILMTNSILRFHGVPSFWQPFFMLIFCARLLIDFIEIAPCIPGPLPDLGFIC